MSKKKFLVNEESAPSVREAELTKVLENNITEYGLSVVEDRMIPSVRDGLKPAQRRLLKAMYDMKCWNSSPTVKSARVLGDCFTGDTAILDVNGNPILISDLYEKIEHGEKVYTFSSKSDGTIVAAKVVKCWIASEVSDIVEVTLDNGETFRCTKDHRILGRDGTYIEAGKLEEGTSLMPVYMKLNEEGLEVNEENWTNSMKHSNEVGYKKFMSDPIYEELRPAPYNHKVKSVKFIHLDHKIPVYNIEVDSEEHNFALACGTFAKNCMGKYHPHSEAYGALQTLVGETYSLVHGQGNWGSIDDDAAAPRYTECKFSKLGQKCLEAYEVAEEVPNFSGEYMEPIDIPMDFPYFFVNGGDGVAVAITFHTPDHNLEEIVNALKIVLKKGDKATMKDLMKVFHGPDCQTGGKLLTPVDELIKIYETGEGKLTYECDYTITPVGKKSFILNVTGYCPKFKPSTFQKDMIKLMDEKVDGDKMVQYANDASTKEKPYNFEVMFVGTDTFEKKIHKHLICSSPVQYYALDRQRSKNPELRDIDTKLLKLSLIDYMKIWLDWRREVESKLLNRDREILTEKIFKSKCRQDAAENLDVIKKALEADDTVKYIAEKLPFLKRHKRAVEGAEYIADLKLSSLKKVDIQKVIAEINGFEKTIEEIDSDLQNIDRVVSRKLDGLKPFFKPRMLKTQE